jgi:flagellar biosynthesis/type III secretory pathway protein FliH
MKRDKLISKIDATLEEYYENGYNDGFAIGYDDGVGDGYIQHRIMVSNRINMHIETCMNTNKYKEAQFAKEMLEYLMWEYDPVEAERKLREEEENSDGFGLIR